MIEGPRVGYRAMADEVLEIIDDGRNDWIEPQGDQKTYRLMVNRVAAPSQPSIRRAAAAFPRV